MDDVVKPLESRGDEGYQSARLPIITVELLQDRC
jgi:hypothetical protein